MPLLARMAASGCTSSMETDEAFHLPHPLLTTLATASTGGETELGADQKAMLLAEAERCIQAMRTRRDDAGWIVGRKAHTIEPAYVAAALALMCRYFRKRNGTWLVCGSNGAAAAFGHEVSRATLVTDKLRQLERLEALLKTEAAGRAAAEAQAAGTSSAGALFPHPAPVPPLSADDAYSTPRPHPTTIVG